MRFLIGAACSCSLMLVVAGTASAQYYPRGYGYVPPAYRASCAAVTPGPLRGAARGAAGGAIIGAIAGNAGRGAAIGAGIHGMANIVRRGVARSSGYCY